jgi:hypothetical protein
MLFKGCLSKINYDVTFIVTYHLHHETLDRNVEGFPMYINLELFI